LLEQGLVSCATQIRSSIGNVICRNATIGHNAKRNVNHVVHKQASTNRAATSIEFVGITTRLARINSHDIRQEGFDEGESAVIIVANSFKCSNRFTNNGASRAGSRLFAFKGSSFKVWADTVQRIEIVVGKNKSFVDTRACQAFNLGVGAISIFG
jgi:hypothetical protein